MRRFASALLGALCLARAASAQPPALPAAPPRGTPPAAKAPDLAFLEYLGSWQGNDDEWLAIREWDKDTPPKGEADEHKERSPDPSRNEHDKGE